MPEEREETRMLLMNLVNVAVRRHHLHVHLNRGDEKMAKEVNRLDHWFFELADDLARRIDHEE